MSATCALRGVLAGAAIGAALAVRAAAEDPFAIRSFTLPGRVVQADLVDFDGDERGDLLCVHVEGMPPDERRTLDVFYQRPDHSFAAEPDWSVRLPSGSAAYDLANLDANAGAELILLRRDRLTILSLAGRAPAWRDLVTGPGSTIALADDERGIDRLQLARPELGDGPRLLVPGLGTAAVLSPSGESLGRIEVGARANYYLPKRPGPFVAESEAQIFFDHPRLSAGDVDGDGRGDIVSATRHELRVFLQDANGRFPGRASRSAALRLLAPEDYVRNAGSVRVDGVDLDGDRRLDLLISHTAGNLFSATTTVRIHMNRGGRWDLAKPDQQFRAEGGLTGNVVIDLDGDGTVELVEARVPASVLEVVEALVTRAIDADVSIYRRGESSPFDPKPWHRWTLDVPFSFTTFRSLGFIPTLEADLNGDGIHDLLGSTAGDRLEVRLGRKQPGYGVIDASQALDTGGRIRFGDVDGDELTDFVLYDPRRPGTPVLVGTNRGVLAR